MLWASVCSLPSFLCARSQWSLRSMAAPRFAPCWLGRMVGVADLDFLDFLDFLENLENLEIPFRVLPGSELPALDHAADSLNVVVIALGVVVLCETIAKAKG